MKISRICICKTERPYVVGAYAWGAGNAIRVARATNDLDHILEQRCRTYEECRKMRRVAQLQTKFDECVTGLHAAQRTDADRGAETCGLNISRLGAPVAEYML